MEEPGSQSSCARREGNAELGAGRTPDVDRPLARAPHHGAPAEPATFAACAPAPAAAAAPSW